MKSKKENIAQDILRLKCTLVETPEEAEIIIQSLSSILNKTHQAILAAPEVNVAKTIAIIRTEKFNFDLVNPTIVDRNSDVISFGEKCISFPDAILNCLRSSVVTVETGVIVRQRHTFTDDQAFQVQHAIDHLNSTLFFDKAIRLGIVRNNGAIKDSDYCPCGSRKKNKDCLRNH